MLGAKYLWLNSISFCAHHVRCSLRYLSDIFSPPLPIFYICFFSLSPSHFIPLSFLYWIRDTEQTTVPNYNEYNWSTWVFSNAGSIFFPAFLKYNWYITMCKFKMYNVIWFDICTCCQIVTTIRLVNTSVSLHNYHFFVCVVRTFKICSFSNFQIYNTVVSRYPRGGMVPRPTSDTKIHRCSGPKVGLPYLWVLHLQIQQALDHKHSTGCAVGWIWGCSTHRCREWSVCTK